MFSRYMSLYWLLGRKGCQVSVLECLNTEKGIILEYMKGILVICYKNWRWFTESNLKNVVIIRSWGDGGFDEKLWWFLSTNLSYLVINTYIGVGDLRMVCDLYFKWWFNWPWWDSYEIWHIFACLCRQIEHMWTLFFRQKLVVVM